MHTDFQRRLREQRARKGLSQEELAEQAGLSLRTIQRIENGETAPRGDTLKRIAAALKVSPDELIDWQVQEDNNVVTVLNLSQLGFLAFPLLGVIIPLIIWILKKDTIRDVDAVGQSILNFQISWNLLLFSIYAAGLLIIFIRQFVYPALFFSFFIVMGMIYLYNIYQILANTLRYKRTGGVRYRPAFALLK